MDPIHVTLPDGKVQEVPKGTTPADIAKQISPRLADAALVARVAAPNDGAGELIDLRRPLDHDVKLQILTEKDPDALFVFRHSAAHLLAAAVMELYPNVKLGIGPPIDTGFFYEFLREQPFTPDDLAKIEAKMHDLAAQDLPNERKLMPKPSSSTKIPNKSSSVSSSRRKPSSPSSPSTPPVSSSTFAAARTFPPQSEFKPSN
jgi:threonyl-tRNA synthetase